MGRLLTATVRYGYASLMLLGINGAAIWLAGSGASKAWMLGLLGAAVAVSFTAERVLPYEPAWNHPAGAPASSSRADW